MEHVDSRYCGELNWDCQADLGGKLQLPGASLSVKGSTAKQQAFVLIPAGLSLFSLPVELN